MPDLSLTGGQSRRSAARLQPIAGGAGPLLRCESHVLSTVSAIRDLRHLTRAFLNAAGVSNDNAAVVELAVGEALANVHRHAYGGDTGPIDFTLEVEGAELTCAICDRGCAAAELKVPAEPPAPLGGFGLVIMRELMDEVEISHPDGAGHGTLVRMRKTLAPTETHTT